MATGVGNQSITVEFSGVGASEIVRMFGSIARATPVDFGSRTGNGDITKTGLVNGTIYEAWGQIEASAGGPFGIASPSIFLVPVATGDSPTTAVSAFMTEIRDLFLNSSNLAAWIITVDAGGGTAGRVFLGRRPNSLPDVETGGPIVTIYPESLNMETAADKTMVSTVDIIGDVLWFESNLATKDRVRELNFLFGMADEFNDDASLSLSNTFGGIIRSITVEDLVEEELADFTEFHAEIRFTISFGV